VYKTAELGAHRGRTVFREPPLERPPPLLGEEVDDVKVDGVEYEP
jgi:hypothetical protein